MILTREVGSLEAWCRRATAHDMRIQSAVVTVVQVCGKVEVPGAPACVVLPVPIDALIEV